MSCGAVRVGESSGMRKPCALMRRTWSRVLLVRSGKHPDSKKPFTVIGKVDSGWLESRRLYGEDEAAALGVTHVEEGAGCITQAVVAPLVGADNDVEDGYPGVVEGQGGSEDADEWAEEDPFGHGFDGLSDWAND